MISKGLVDDARAAARATVARLAPVAARGEPIVGLEPSCLLSLRDEYLFLLPGDERARAVAERAGRKPTGPSSNGYEGQDRG